MDDLDFRKFEESMERMERSIDRIHDEFDRLRSDPSGRFPEKGDRVVVAIGLLGHGNNWVRHDAIVLETGEASVHVAWADDRIPDKFHHYWVHPALITDVLGKVQP